jgi:hypothetical protein
MGHDDRREIFERLEALERLVRSRSGGDEGRGEHRGGGRGRRDHDRHDRRDGHDRDDRHDRHGRHDRHDHYGRHDRDDRHERGHHGHGRDDRDDDRRRGGGDGDFQEKRIIDTIVQLVGERLERFIQDQQAKAQRHGDDGKEGRIVDQAVRLVSENVREIVQRVVANELDRRVGPPRDRRPNDAPPEGEREPE